MCSAIGPLVAWMFDVEAESADPCLFSAVVPTVALMFDVEVSSTAWEVEQAMATENKKKTIEIPVNSRMPYHLFSGFDLVFDLVLFMLKDTHMYSQAQIGD